MKIRVPLPKRKIFLVPIGLLVGILIWLLVVKPLATNPLDKYQTDIVVRENIRETLTASGEISAEKMVNLQFQTSGRLAWVGVKEGDRVKKWQAIASLDKEQLQKNLQKAMNTYLTQRWIFEQTQDDYKDERDRFILTDEMKRILEKSNFTLDSSVRDYEIANLAVKYATLVTPIDGIVTHIDTPVAGVNILPTTANFVIADPSVMKFVANIDEQDIGLIKLNQQVEIRLDAYPEQLINAKINKIAFVSTTTSSGSTVYPVEIILPNQAEIDYKVGLNGDMEIIMDQLQDVLTVDSAAINFQADQPQVRVLQGRQIKNINITTGLESASRTQIISGLTEGEIVVVNEKSR